MIRARLNATCLVLMLGGACNGERKPVVEATPQLLPRTPLAQASSSSSIIASFQATSRTASLTSAVLNGAEVLLAEYRGCADRVIELQVEEAIKSRRSPTNRVVHVWAAGSCPLDPSDQSDQQVRPSFRASTTFELAPGTRGLFFLEPSALDGGNFDLLASPIAVDAKHDADVAVLRDVVAFSMEATPAVRSARLADWLRSRETGRVVAALDIVDMAALAEADAQRGGGMPRLRAFEGLALAALGVEVLELLEAPGDAHIVRRGMSAALSLGFAAAESPQFDRTVAVLIELVGNADEQVSTRAYDLLLIVRGASPRDDDVEGMFAPCGGERDGHRCTIRWLKQNQNKAAVVVAWRAWHQSGTHRRRPADPLPARGKGYRPPPDDFGRLPVAITAQELLALRTHGVLKFDPSDAVRATMIADGKQSVTIGLNVFVDSRGVPWKAGLNHPSGYPEYDKEVQTTVLEWVLKPYLLDGAPAPVRAYLEFTNRL